MSPHRGYKSRRKFFTENEVKNVVDLLKWEQVGDRDGTERKGGKENRITATKLCYDTRFCQKNHRTETKSYESLNRNYNVS